jgi:nitroimidazol reductase NimA-like FMN-containing flavoprotein (pyridoxamine 5'-phosphate oxidase superfamily)
MPRPRIEQLATSEIDDLLSLDVPAHLATIDPDGYPRITPLWFLWEDGAPRPRLALELLKVG